MKVKERHCVENFVPKTFDSKTLVYISIENENGCNKLFNFEMAVIISDLIALHSVPSPSINGNKKKNVKNQSFTRPNFENIQLH